MKCSIKGLRHTIKTKVQLPSSKSISNRVLVIQELCDGKFTINNLSRSEDTMLLKDALCKNGDWNAGLGGTTARFLLALASIKGESKIITGHDSLKKRPLADLVDALNKLGAQITYLENEGHFPVRVNGKITKGGVVNLKADVSSQYISALMLVAPKLEGGLKIILDGDVVSQPYLDMTRIVMQDFGIDVSFNNGVINIPSANYKPRNYFIETDWSAASYWYEIAALADEADIFLGNLVDSPLQGDRVIIDIMKKLGVESIVEDGGINLRKNSSSISGNFILEDLSSSPDLAPALIGSVAGMGLSADFLGLKNFRLKESDRAAALQRELYKFNVKTDFCGGSKFKVYSSELYQNRTLNINTYDDHRVALSLAPLALKAGEVIIEDPDVVKKSYPEFWNHLSNAGFDVSRHSE